MGEAWKGFARTGPGRNLREFFTILRKEIADNNASGLKGRECVLLLNTRKGYWVYKIFQKEEPGDAVKVYSDRFLQKMLDFTELKGKIIYLADDTLIQGHSLLETYEILAREVDEDFLCPVVFAMCDTVDVAQKRRSATGIAKSFWDRLKYYLLMSEDEISELCITETQLIHSEGIPNMIDLPFLRDSGRANSQMDFQFRLTKQQFKILQRKREKWTFHFNENSVEDKNVLLGFIMQMENEQLFQETKEFVYDFVMEGTYIEDGNDGVLIVLTPFAILKSMSKDFLLDLWETLIDREGDSAGNAGPDSAGDDVTDRNRWIRYHRECVYVLSMMVAESFRREVAEEAGIKFEYDYDILKDHFPQDMIEKMRQTEKSIKDDENLFWDRLKKVSCRKNDCICGKKEPENNRADKIRYDQAKAYKETWQILKDTKDEFILLQSCGQTSEQKPTSLLEIGRIEKLLDDKFEFVSVQERRYALTRVVVTILRSSVCGNKLEISPDRKCLMRGFRYGENSDLLLPFFDLFFYWAVILLVSKYEMDGAERRYADFTAKLRRRYEELKLLSDDTAKDNFGRNCIYYKKALEGRQYLYNKYCFVQPYLCNKVSTRKAYYMEKMEEFVEKDC